MQGSTFIRTRLLKLIKTTNYTRDAFSLTLSPLSVKVFSILSRKKIKIGINKKTKQKKITTMPTKNKYPTQYLQKYKYPPLPHHQKITKVFLIPFNKNHPIKKTTKKFTKQTTPNQKRKKHPKFIIPNKQTSHQTLFDNSIIIISISIKRIPASKLTPLLNHPQNYHKKHSTNLYKKSQLQIKYTHTCITQT
jgi:hypothetical protein